MIQLKTRVHDEGCKASHRVLNKWTVVGLKVCNCVYLLLQGVRPDPSPEGSWFA